MSEHPHPRVALLGAGQIGEALLAGLLAGGHPPQDLVLSERSEARAQEVARRHGVRAEGVAAAADGADVLVVAVKPPDAAGLLDSLPPLLPGALVVSLCAGLSTAHLQEHLPSGTPVVRVMPNTPMLVGEGMSALSAGSHATDAHLDLVEGLLATVGRVVRVPEAQQDAVTALSGSGPAYLFLVVEALVEAGVQLGLPRAVATALVTQTAVGAALMARDSGEHPTLLREAVTSPGGTTAAGLAALEQHGIRTAMAAAASAASTRSRELGA